jgi:trk system potassium uptake protein TrkA
MYIIIGGAGLLELNLAERLTELGHPIALIDVDPTACHYAREQLGVMVFEGSRMSLVGQGARGRGQIGF